MMDPSSKPTEKAPKMKKERSGFDHVFSRVKSALKKSDAPAATAPAAAPAAAPAPGRNSAPQSAAVPANVSVATDQPPVASVTTANYVEVTIKLPPQCVHAKAAEARARYEAMRGVSKLSKSELFQERARKLSERFGVDIHASHWPMPDIPSDTVLRIDKPIRLRIRRTCHRCDATFASSKECPNCQHVRCSNCGRYPPKLTEAELIASREKRAAIIIANKANATIVVDWDWKNQNVVLKRPRKAGGQDLIHKKTRQRVRRTCHVCSTLFTNGSKQCQECDHVRCTDCPRDPPKKEKYPLGYPGDAFSKSSIPHFECEKCHTLYETNAPDGTPCSKCKTPKSNHSPRALPRKMEPAIDADLLEQTQAKLNRLKIT